MRFHSAFHRSKQVIATFVSLSLLWTSCNLAEAAQPAAVRPISFELAPPSNLGGIVDSFTSVGAGERGSESQKPLVILIQDLHAHYGVQKNIAGILDFLTARLSDKAIKQLGNTQSPNRPIAPLPFALAVEGASGPIDSSILALFPDQKIKQEAADYLMREGELTGAEYFAAMRGLPQALHGVEDMSYYTMHRDLFRKTLVDREALVKQLTQMQQDLLLLRRRTYSKPVRAIQVQIDAFEKGDIATGDFIRYLAGLAQNYALPLGAGYPTLARYLSNPRSIDSAQAATLHRESSELAYRLKAAEAATPQEKDLIHVEHDLALLLRVTDLQATEEEVRDFGPRLNQFIALAKALCEKSFDEAKLRPLISSSIDYYVIALMRNKPMVDNTLALLSNQKTAVLVAGGFHTAPITQILRQKNISYLVITPSVDKITDADHELYVKRLSGNLLTEEEILAQANDRHSELAKIVRKDTAYTLARLLQREDKTLAIGIGVAGIGVLLTVLWATGTLHYHHDYLPQLAQYLSHLPSPAYQVAQEWLKHAHPLFGSGSVDAALAAAPLVGIPSLPRQKIQLPEGELEFSSFETVSIKELIPSDANKLTFDEHREIVGFQSQEFTPGESDIYMGPVMVIHGFTVKGRLFIGDRPANEVINEIAKSKGLTKVLLVSCNPFSGELGPTSIPVIFSTGIVRISESMLRTYTAFGRWRTNNQKSVGELAHEISLGSLFNHQNTSLLLEDHDPSKEKEPNPILTENTEVGSKPKPTPAPSAANSSTSYTPLAVAGAVALMSVGMLAGKFILAAAGLLLLLGGLASWLYLSSRNSFSPPLPERPLPAETYVGTLPRKTAETSVENQPKLSPEIFAQALERLSQTPYARKSTTNSTLDKNQRYVDNLVWRSFGLSNVQVAFIQQTAIGIVTANESDDARQLGKALSEMGYDWSPSRLPPSWAYLSSVSSKSLQAFSSLLNEHPIIRQRFQNQMRKTKGTPTLDELLQAVQAELQNRQPPAPPTVDQDVAHEPGEGYLEFLVAAAQSQLANGPQILRDKFAQAIAVAKAQPAMGGLTKGAPRVPYVNEETVLAYAWLIFIARRYYSNDATVVVKRMNEIRKLFYNDTLVHEWVENYLRNNPPPITLKLFVDPRTGKPLTPEAAYHLIAQHIDDLRYPDGSLYKDLLDDDLQSLATKLFEALPDNYLVRQIAASRLSTDNLLLLFAVGKINVEERWLARDDWASHRPANYPVEAAMGLAKIVLPDDQTPPIGGAMTMGWIYRAGSYIGLSPRATEIILAPVLELPLHLFIVVAGSVFPALDFWFIAHHPDKSPNKIMMGLEYSRWGALTVGLAGAASLYLVGLSTHLFPMESLFI